MSREKKLDRDGVLKVGILGTGKLGTDLLIKTLRSNYLQCVMFSGRNSHSEGIKKAKSMNIATSTQSIDAFEGLGLDFVFDVTSAEQHRQHAATFSNQGIRAIDLTPSKVGPFCIPSINPQIIEHEMNINLVTCGGQSAIPILNCLSIALPEIERVNVHSMLAEDSVGPATLANIDDYYATTQRAIGVFSGVEQVNVELSVEKSVWKPDMLTDIRVWTPSCDIELIYKILKQRLEEVRKYVPGYHIVGTPRYEGGCINITVSICGLGDWIPSHAGNLDIINCAAIAIAEHYAKKAKPRATKPKRSLGVGSWLGRLARRKEGAYA